MAVLDKDDKEAATGKADDKGVFIARLGQYTIKGDQKAEAGAYTVKTADKQQTVEMTEDRTISMK